MAQQSNRDARDVSVFQVAAGGYGMYAAKDRILGQVTAYHGTSKANAAKIREEGLRAAMGGSAGGSSAAAGSERFLNESRGKVHVTQKRAIANMFSHVAGNPNFSMDQFGGPQTMLRKGPNGDVVKLKMDYDKFHRMEADPDMHGPFGASKRMAARGTEDIGVHEIVGSKIGFAERMKYRASKMPDYIKNHTGRFAGGMALGVGGAALAIHGLTRKRRDD